MILRPKSFSWTLLRKDDIRWFEDSRGRLNMIWTLQRPLFTRFFFTLWASLSSDGLQGKPGEPTMTKIVFSEFVICRFFSFVLRANDVYILGHIITCLFTVEKIKVDWRYHSRLLWFVLWFKKNGAYLVKSSCSKSVLRYFRLLLFAC